MVYKVRRYLGHLIRGGRGILSSLQKVPKISDSLEKGQLGFSQSGKSIFYYKVGSGSLKVALIFGIHGNEVGTVKQAKDFLKYTENTITIFDKLTIFIVPVLNIDGYTLAVKDPDYLNDGKIGRVNSRGVDINRNFDVNSFEQNATWSFGKNYSENVNVFCGEKGGSESETKALTNFITKESIETVYSFHNAGKDILPGTTKHSEEMANIFSEHTGYPIMSEEGWANLKQTGTLKEWCDHRKISFLEIEGETRWGSDWRNQKKAIIETLLYLNNH